MTNLERLALLGDKNAQKECTEKGILVPCPLCGGETKTSETTTDKENKFEFGWIGCQHCRCFINYINNEKGKRQAIEVWNTRQAPPIGRCEECRYRTWFVPGYGCGNFDSPFYAAAQEDVPIMTKPADYCSYFEPRCEE